MKKFLTLALLVFALSLPAATIQWYSQQPHITPGTNDIVALERTTPHAYGYVFLTDILDLMGGAPGAPPPPPLYTINVTSNAYFYGDTYLSNAFITNLTVFETVIVSNFVAVNVTNNFQITTNLYAYYTTNKYAYITNLYATYITNQYFWTTNANITFLTNYESYISNAYITNLNVNKLTVENIYYQGTFPLLSTWVGPTNSLNVSNQWEYVTYTPCDITNFVGGIAGRASDSSLSVSNASDSNITVWITAASARSGDYTNAWVVTNGNVLDIGFRNMHGVWTKYLSGPRQFAP